MDWHCGSRVGLMPPEQWQLKGGGHISPSNIQKTIWEHFSTNVADLATRRKGKRLIVVYNGDAIEGVHHNSVFNVSNQVSDHENIHIECMDYFLRKTKFDSAKGDLLYYIGGTPSHVGEGWESEQTIAKDFDAVPYHKSQRESEQDNVYPHPVLRLELHGVKFEFAHQGPGPGTRVWSRGNSIRSFIRSIYYERLMRGDWIPDYFIWGHNHQYVSETVQIGEDAISHGIIGPSMQGPTDYVYKRFAHTYTQVGTLGLEINENGNVETFCDRIQLEPITIQKL